MKKPAMIGALGALAQETRLDIFRLLVQKGPEGLPAGDIGARLGQPFANDVVSPEPAQIRRSRHLTAGEPLDNLLRELQGDERSARLPH